MDVRDSRNARQLLTGDIGLGVLRAHWVLVGRFLITSFGRTLTTVAVIMLIREFLSGVLGETRGISATLLAGLPPATALWVVVGALFSTFLLGSVLNYDNQIVLQRLVRLFELSLTERLLRHLLRLPVAFFDTQQHGDLLESVRQDVMKTRLSVMAVLDLGIQGSQVVAILASVIYLSPKLALSSLPVLILAAIPVWWVARRVRQRSFRARRLGFVLSDLILQIIRGIRLVKIYAGEEAETQSSIRHARRYFNEAIASARVRSLGQVALEALGGLSIVIVTVVGGFQVLDGSLTVPELVAFLLAARTLHGPLNALNVQFMDIQRNWASVTRVRELLDTKADVRDSAGAVRFEGPLRSIEFQDVSFAYGGATTPVLSHLSFEVKMGEQIGIVGPSGAGKSTLIGLAARFHDPTDGQVLLNGTDMRTFKLADVYDHVSIVTQDPFLFGTTVRENIRYGRPAATDVEVERAARAAEIHDEITRLPEGYDTVVGVGGRSLSGGQIQRVNVARAILKDAPLVLLDEATSSLDSIAEMRVQAAFNRLKEGRTTLIVAHRLSTLRHANRIIVLDKGQCVGMGTHESLLLSCPLYRTLWRTQEMSGSSETGRTA